MNESLMKHGAFSWSELMTTDVEAAKRFYGALFGWETEEFLGAGMPYTLIKVNGGRRDDGPIAGMHREAPCLGRLRHRGRRGYHRWPSGNPGRETPPPTDRHPERRPLLRPPGLTRRDLVRDHVSAALNATQARPSGSPPVARNQGPTVFALINW